jgi:hypothetical protein
MNLQNIENKRAEIGTVISPKKAPIRIHINQHAIRSNKQQATNLPVITVKRGSDNFYCNGVEVVGTTILRYAGAGCDTKPILSCGARLVMETEDSVLVTD